jgi:hypothetical protein
LFNLSSSRQFTNKGKGGICSHSGCGPKFGANNSEELSAIYEPYNGDGKCRSWANRDGYKIVIEGGKNMLTNKEDGWFTISELEVWEVVNVENIVVKKQSNCSNQ